MSMTPGDGSWRWLSMMILDAAKTLSIERYLDARHSWHSWHSWRCRDDVETMSRRCRGDVETMSRRCRDDVETLGDRGTMSRWCRDDVEMWSRWCLWRDDVANSRRWLLKMTIDDDSGPCQDVTRMMPWWTRRFWHSRCSQCRDDFAINITSTSSRRWLSMTLNDVETMSLEWCWDDVLRWDDVLTLSTLSTMSVWCQDDVETISRWCWNDVKMMSRCSRHCRDDVEMNVLVWLVVDWLFVWWLVSWLLVCLVAVWFVAGVWLVVGGLLFWLVVDWLFVWLVFGW